MLNLPDAISFIINGKYVKSNDHAWMRNNRYILDNDGMIVVDRSRSNHDSLPQECVATQDAKAHPSAGYNGMTESEVECIQGGNVVLTATE